MTYSIRHVIGIVAFSRGDRAPRENFFGTKNSLLGNWGEMGDMIWKYIFGCHLGHLLEIGVAVLCYVLLYGDGDIWVEARDWQLGWVSRIFFFNLTCEVILCTFWHWMTYASAFSAPLAEVKYNPTNQYEPGGGRAGFVYSETGNLEREILFTTLGWLQSASWQCLFTHLWACGSLPFYTDFWSCPAYSLPLFGAITYWREMHFYFAHRFEHPWWDRKNGLLNGDIGAFLYRHVHSVHHKSYNPGPWSGLSMHPVEHLLYYSCATLPPLVLSVHPLHFLYAKFHCDISPLGGHDGHTKPSPGSDYHWLHHAKFECNYGVPFPINMDRIFGTWVDHADFKQSGEIKSGAWALSQMHDPDEDTSDPKKEPLLEAEDAPWQLRSIDWEEVRGHTRREDCWVVLFGQVLNVTAFLAQHPGGEKVLLDVAGTDATETFLSIHSSSGGYGLVAKWAPDAPIGTLAGYDGPAPPKIDKEEGCRKRSLLGDPLLLLMPCLALSAAGAFGAFAG